MLERLSIENIALIKKGSIEFKEGLNVLTGETGAGKSLIIDSLSLLLGERADKGLITRGEKNARVEAVFSNISSKVKEAMLDLGLDQDDALVISRKISIDGKNDCRVNGNSFSLSMLKKLSPLLMDLHGQFEHQNLLKTQSHLTILDSFGAKEIDKPKKDYYKAYLKYNEIIGELEGFIADDKERARLIELYTYQLEELENANFYEGEEEELKEYRNQVLHQEKIVEAINGAIKLASGDGYEYQGSLESIKKMIVMLSGVEPYFAEASKIISALESVKLDFEDIVENLEDKLDKLYIDEEKARENEQRLDLLSSFKKKYGYTIKEINDYKEQITKQLDKLVNSQERVENLKIEEEKTRQELLLLAGVLTKAREKVAEEFKKVIEIELKDLGMKNSTFSVEFSPLDIEKRTANGLDKIEFMFSANLGEPVKPIKEVASGGEMSRFMLAVKNVTAKIEGIATLIFDEIDTGVSGTIALALAEKLASVSKMAQVICVTHLPQIASYGTNHLLITKSEEDGKTTTMVETLTKEQRVNEIARLISGNITSHSLLHAEEMLEKGKIFNKNLK